MGRVQLQLQVSERRACQALGVSGGSCRYERGSYQGEELRQRVTDLATEYGRYGYRRIKGILREEGWRVNHKRTERIWREEGLKVPARQPKRRRLWLNEASCIRLRPTHAMHVWSYDMVSDRTSNGKSFRILNVLDKYSRECLACVVERQITSQTVLETLCELFARRGIPEHIRSDNGSEFTAHAVRTLLADLGVKTLFIEPGSPWENGYVGSFNAKMRDELLERELIDTLWEAKTLCGRWVRQYNTVRPHSALGYRPPAPEAQMPPALGELIFVT